jgi:hypothetical protein
MYDHGVDAAFVREMRGLGYTDLTPNAWVDLRDNGVEDDDTDTDDQGGVGVSETDAAGRRRG